MNVFQGRLTVGSDRKGKRVRRSKLLGEGENGCWSHRSSGTALLYAERRHVVPYHRCQVEAPKSRSPNTRPGTKSVFNVNTSKRNIVGDGPLFSINLSGGTYRRNHSTDRPKSLFPVFDRFGIGLTREKTLNWVLDSIGSCD